MTRTNGRDLRITDFGLARRIGSKLYPLEYGMPEFVAPEIVLGHGVGLAADMWSVGVITYLLLSGRSLFRGRNDMETLDNIKVTKGDRYFMLFLTLKFQSFLKCRIDSIEGWNLVLRRLFLIIFFRSKRFSD